jgi:eukaryotic-like serine/threonine-protein kinase
MPSIVPGAKVDRYQIVSLLGAGGMGEVYLAQDTRLNRKVALKFLPPHFTRDRERVRRFAQEAQAASALNHPNIITIYEVGRADEVHFIATEFIEGLTVRRRISGTQLPTEEALEITSQICSALVAAHSAGIVHRDIKPENIMIRPDGYVKILDFGLAKLTERSEGTSQLDAGSGTAPEIITDEQKIQDLTADTGSDHYQTSALSTVADTAPGVVMGTAQYMSPEHARGLKVDQRTDIFTLGIVLYEMLAGKHPFSGPTRRDVVAAVINSDPPPLAAFRNDLPDVLEWIVQKALAKDREERYQTARELLNDLKRLQQRIRIERELSRAKGYTTPARMGLFGLQQGDNLTTTDNPSGPLGKVSGRFKVFLTQGTRFNQIMRVVSVLLLLGLVVAYQYWLRRPERTPFSDMKLTRFTTTGRSIRAAVSPDGKYVVYAQSDEGKQSLWVRQVAATTNVEIVRASEVFYRGLTFSPDGAFLYYIVQEGSNPIQVLYQIPAPLGGQPRKLMVDIDSPVGVSPDGTQMAFVRRARGKGEDTLVVARIDGSDERVITKRKETDFLSLSGVAWSADGKNVACPAGSNAGGRNMGVVDFRVSDGRERPWPKRRWANIGRITWLNNGGMVISATDSGSTFGQLWYLSSPSAEPKRISNDLNDYRDMNLTEDSKAIAAVQFEAHVNVWLAPLGDATTAKQITSGVGQYNGVRGLTWTKDRLVYVSRISGSQDIWTMQEDGQNPKQLTTPEQRADIYPAISPDGQSIVFVSTRNGSSNIYRMDIDGGSVAQLTSGTSDEFPDISPDGKWVVYTATGSSNFRLWRVPFQGGNPDRLTDRLSQWPSISPDGKLIACWYRAETTDPWQPAIIPFEGGAPTKVFSVPATSASSIPMRWTQDGRGLCYVDTQNGVSNIWMQPIDGSVPRRLTNFLSDQIFWFSWAPGHDRFAVSRGSITSDVVLFTEGR